MPEILVMKFDARKAMQQLRIVSRAQGNQFKLAVRQSMTEAGSQIWLRVDKDIARAGAFSERWPAAYQVHNRMQGFNAIMTTGFSSAIPYAHVHEFGATIRGKPLLWIPLSFSDVPKIGPGSTRMRARNYPGGLFRVERPGRNPLLFSAQDKKPKYVGVTHVTLRPRFHIRSIVANVVRTQLAKLFAKYVKGVKL